MSPHSSKSSPPQPFSVPGDTCPWGPPLFCKVTLADLFNLLKRANVGLFLGNMHLFLTWAFNLS